MTEYATYIPEKQYARPEVKSFSDIMEFKLRANDYKGGWTSDDPNSLFAKLEDKVRDMSMSLEGHKHDAKMDAWDLIYVAADIANYAMMVADNVRRNYDVNGITEGIRQLPDKAPQ